MAQLLRHRTTRKVPPPQSVDTILGSLTHYVKPKNKFKDPLLPSLNPEEEIYLAADPFGKLNNIYLLDRCLTSFILVGLFFIFLNAI